MINVSEIISSTPHQRTKPTLGYYPINDTQWNVDITLHVIGRGGEKDDIDHVLAVVASEEEAKAFIQSINI